MRLIWWFSNEFLEVFQKMSASTDRYIPNAFVAETMAAIQAMTFAADPGFMHVVFEGDSLTIIKKLTSHNEDRLKISGLFFWWKGFIKEKLLLSNVTYIHPSANIVAHDLICLQEVVLGEMEEVPVLPDVAVDGYRRGWFGRLNFCDLALS
ncbi:hypothetical protein Goshw_006912 [Gossypium schwendimanii]|uniref:RNase H type-1 domain-containing protein n=1 Tax=Gossypium schwendimanii TaxID=34291 RepID=A0A7J9KQT5_GOSSC|nr:hypothetical protein [Gossypium schwendimanii]